MRNKLFISMLFITTFGFGQPSFTAHTITTSADQINGERSVYAVDVDGDGEGVIDAN